jgi:type II secretory pathway component GspD/PulD (secretin)
VNVQEMDSVIKMNSGQAIVMGGLMQDRNDSTEVGVPVMSEIPVVGALFKNHGDALRKSELVVFLKATIVSGDNTDDTDKDIYNTFSGDRHPLKL